MLRAPLQPQHGYASAMNRNAASRCRSTNWKPCRGRSSTNCMAWRRSCENRSSLMLWNATGEGTGGPSHCACAATTTTRQSALAAQRHHATQPSGCSRVLACAVRPIPAMIRPSITRGPTYCSSSPFSRAAARPAGSPGPRVARPASNRYPPGDASAGHLMAFRPRLTIGGGAGADAVQQGDEGVRVQRRAIRRRVVDRVRGRGVGLGHGWAPCVHAEAATDKGGGRCVVRNPVFAEPAGTRPPRTARHSRPTDCQPAPHRVMPAGKRLLQRTTGVSNPGHLFSVARKEIRPVVRDANAVRPMPTPLSTFSE